MISYISEEIDVNTNLKKKIAILALSIYVASNSVISGTLVFMQKDLGLSITSAEMMVTLASIASIITILLNEKITQKVGMKKCVDIGLFLVGLSSILPVLSKSYPAIFISRLLMGAGVGLFNGHSANYINVLFSGDEASKLHGFRISAEFIGQMLLLFLAGLLIKIQWQYAFLVYFIAFIIMINFNINIPELDIHEEANDSGKFKLNGQIIFYVVFIAFIILNNTAISVRFASIATIAKGMDADISLYMLVLPISGMISGFLFGLINQSLREKTLYLGLGVYIMFNLVLAFFGYNMYIYIGSMVFLAFAQSLCIPYLFTEVARFARGAAARIANNLLFIGCNIGGFVAPFFMQGVNRLYNTQSLTLAFSAFSIVYAIILGLNIYEYKKVRGY